MSPISLDSTTITRLAEAAAEGDFLNACGATGIGEADCRAMDGTFGPGVKSVLTSAEREGLLKMGIGAQSIDDLAGIGGFGVAIRRAKFLAGKSCHAGWDHTRSQIAELLELENAFAKSSFADVRENGAVTRDAIHRCGDDLASDIADSAGKSPEEFSSEVKNNIVILTRQRGIFFRDNAFSTQDRLIAVSTLRRLAGLADRSEETELNQLVPRIGDAFVSVLENSGDDENVIIAVASALGHIRHLPEKAVPLLLNLPNGRHYDIAFTVAWALGEYGSLNSSDPKFIEFKDRIVERLLRDALNFGLANITVSRFPGKERNLSEAAIAAFRRMSAEDVISSLTRIDPPDFLTPVPFESPDKSEGLYFRSDGRPETGPRPSLQEERRRFTSEAFRSIIFAIGHKHARSLLLREASSGSPERASRARRYFEVLPFSSLESNEANETKDGGEPGAPIRIRAAGIASVCMYGSANEIVRQREIKKLDELEAEARKSETDRKHAPVVRDAKHKCVDAIARARAEECDTVQKRIARIGQLIERLNARSFFRHEYDAISRWTMVSELMHHAQLAHASDSKELAVKVRTIGEALVTTLQGASYEEEDLLIATVSALGHMRYSAGRVVSRLLNLPVGEDFDLTFTAVWALGQYGIDSLNESRQTQVVGRLFQFALDRDLELRAVSRLTGRTLPDECAGTLARIDLKTFVAALLRNDVPYYLSVPNPIQRVDNASHLFDDSDDDKRMRFAQNNFRALAERLGVKEFKRMLKELPRGNEVLEARAKEYLKFL